MKERAYSIDILRGLAILGMVLSGQMIWSAELPAWMFHAQTPPPGFKFDPTVAGITWVDLVFPFFLFSMGAAFPLSLRGRIEHGAGLKQIATQSVKRWALLVLFAVALANTRSHALPEQWSPCVKSVVSLCVWGVFFCMFVRLPSLGRRANNLLNICGVAGIVAVLLFGHYVHGMNVSIRRSDIIILVLANMVLFGTLAWWFTRDCLSARLAVVAIIVALKISSSVEGSWTAAVWNFSPVPWLYRAEFLKYLCIVLPGSIVGDLVRRRMCDGREDDKSDDRSKVFTITLLALTVIILNMWGLFTRHTTINVIGTLFLGATALLIARRARSADGRLFYRLLTWGFFWLLLGLAFEPFEGGIKKDPATIGYFFITSGLASFTIVVASVMIDIFGLKMRTTVRCGQNPMMAYTAAGYIIMPLLTLVGAAPLLVDLAAMGPWFGVLRGAIVTAIVAIVAILFTNKKIFWRT
ncbi:MAG: DUF5009 domain-containing protein [Rikenellaceae bacterium]|jgi:predicted acyltransferase|nr:DUF5009 domain-containing protein [Rikenellaceae bacterium]